MKKNYLVILLFLITAFVYTEANAKTITISCLKELASYARMSDNRVRLKAGTYKLSDYLTADSIAAKTTRKDYQYINFSGNDNTFDFEGVEIEIDTRLRELLKFPIHTTEIMVSGNLNILRGLKITCVGNGLSPGGATFEVSGQNNTTEGGKY